jgi:hypothetical protein
MIMTKVQLSISVYMYIMTGSIYDHYDKFMI